MNKKRMIGSAVISMLLGFGLVNVASAASSSGEKVGDMTLYGKSEGDICSFSMLKGKDHTMSSLKNCKNDDYYYFKITGGQPGTQVVFMDSPECNRTEPTYKYLIVGDEGDVLNMTGKRDLEHGGTSEEYLEAHLETYGAPKKGRLGGKLSCVAVW